MDGNFKANSGKFAGEEIAHVPATDIDDILSRKLFLKSNQYIQNYEQGLKEHRERSSLKKKTNPMSKIMATNINGYGDGGDDDDDDDDELFDPLK